MRAASYLLLGVALLGWTTDDVFAEPCIVYTPTECWFNLPSDPKQEPIAYPKCAFHTCEFDQAASMRCPFPSKGTFSTVELDSCPDFMKVEERSLPDCTSACCGGVVPGTFKNSTTDPAVRDYVADDAAKCTYVDYRRAEIVEKLLGENIDIVVAGDSMMRQNYLRLLQLMRGRRRIFDYRVHTHASYSYCDELDTFKTASYLADMKQPEKQYLTDVIPQFFARDDSDPEFAKCTRGVGRLDFLHAPLFATHGLSVQAYLKTASPTRRLIVLSYVGVWTKVARIPGHYIQTLERVAAHRAGGVVLSLSVPTFRELRVADRAKKYRERNFKMREWVQLQEGRAGFIDYESLSLMDNAPPTTAHDKHYMCYVTWPQEGRGGPKTATFRSKLLKKNSFRERLYDNPIGNVWMTEDGHCYDEMNRALWKVAFNAIMQTDTSEEDNFLLPRAFDNVVPPIYARGNLKGKTIGELATLELEKSSTVAAAEGGAAAREDGSEVKDDAVAVDPVAADADAAANNSASGNDIGGSNSRADRGTGSSRSSSKNSSSARIGSLKDQSSRISVRSKGRDDSGDITRSKSGGASTAAEALRRSSDRSESFNTEDTLDEKGSSNQGSATPDDSVNRNNDSRSQAAGLESLRGESDNLDASTAGVDLASEEGGDWEEDDNEAVDDAAPEEAPRQQLSGAPRRSAGSSLFKSAIGSIGRVAGTFGADSQEGGGSYSGDEDAADDAMADDQEEGDEDGGDLAGAGAMDSLGSQFKSGASVFSPKAASLVSGNPTELLDTNSESSPIFPRGDARSRD